MPITIRGLAQAVPGLRHASSNSFLPGHNRIRSCQYLPAGEDFDWALLRLNGVELMLNTAYEQDARPSAPDPARVEAHEDAALYFGCEDVDAAYRHLRANGLHVKEPAVAPYGMKQIYLSDPDG